MPSQVTYQEIIKAKRKALRDYEKGRRYYDEKHKTYSPAWRSDNILQHVSDLCGFHGLEAYDPDDTNAARPKYSYVNAGDSYALTLIYNHEAGRFLCSDIGSIIEREENKKEKSEGDF